MANQQDKADNTEQELNEEQAVAPEETAAEAANTAENPAEEPAETAEPQPELSAEEQLQAKVNEINDKYLRLYSDFENFRKRTLKEKADLRLNAAGDVVSLMLPVMDDFERAIASNETSEDVNAIKEGMKLIHHKFHNTLVQQGLKEIDAMEKPFDLDLHEAVTKIPAPDKKLKGNVVDVLEKGYFLNDKVIRYAKVVVGE